MKQLPPLEPYVPPKPPRWWERAKRRAPVAYACGGWVGATWPFLLFYLAFENVSGTNIPVTGPKNWADYIVATGGALSYTGPILLFLVYLGAVWGYRILGSLLVWTVAK